MLVNAVPSRLSTQQALAVYHSLKPRQTDAVAFLSTWDRYSRDLATGPETTDPAPVASWPGGLPVAPVIQPAARGQPSRSFYSKGVTVAVGGSTTSLEREVHVSLPAPRRFPLEFSVGFQSVTAGESLDVYR